MGKIRRSRTKFHVTSTKQTVDEIGEENGFWSTDPKSQILSAPLLSANPFSSVKISKSDLSQNLDLINNDNDVETSPVERSSEEIETFVHLNKKERRILRRENFLKKLETAKVAKEKLKLAKKRASVPVVGDMQPMTLALPTIEAIVGQNNNPPVRKKRKRKPRRFKGQLAKTKKDETFKNLDEKGLKKIQSRRTQKHMLYEIHRFQNSLKNPSFKNNSMKTLSEMIQNNAKKINSDM